MHSTEEHPDSLQWLDGTPFVLDGAKYYQPWIDGDPNEKSYSCVRVAPTYSYRWSDRKCSDEFHAVCETGDATPAAATQTTGMTTTASGVLHFLVSYLVSQAAVSASISSHCQTRMLGGIVSRLASPTTGRKMFW